MKFGKQLEAQVVEEWKFKYLQYKQLKKLIKVITDGDDSPEERQEHDLQFTSALDAEMSKVHEFYFSRLSKAAKQKDAIARQLLEWDNEFSSQKVRTVTTGNAGAADSSTLVTSPPSNDAVGLNEANIEMENMGQEVERKTSEDDSVDIEKDSAEHSHEGDHEKEDDHEEDHEKEDDHEDDHDKKNMEDKRKDDEELHLCQLSSATVAPTVVALGDRKRSFPSPPRRRKTLRPQNGQPIAALSFTKYSALAKIRIKKALTELYRSLELLKSFRAINILAYTKIVKKFEKNTRCSLGDQLLQEMRSSTFHNSTELDSLMVEVESLFKQYFANREHDAKKAMETLRRASSGLISPVAYQAHASELASSSSLVHVDKVNMAFVGGVLSAANVMLLAVNFSIVGTLHNTNFHDAVVTPADIADNNSRRILAFIYFNMGLPFLMANLVGISIFTWDAYKINYRLVFGLVRKLHWSEYILMISILTVIFQILVLLSLSGSLDKVMAPRFQPWLVVGVILVIMFWPLNFFFRSSRYWLGKILVRIAMTPYYPCRFRDFFTANLVNSSKYCIPGLALMIMVSVLGIDGVIADNKNSTISMPVTWFLMILQVPMAYIRMMQCLRRHYDANGGKLFALANFYQLLNACRYALSVISSLVYIVPSIYPDLHWLFYFAVGVRLIYSFYCITWDVVMDFGLSQMRMLTAYSARRKMKMNKGMVTGEHPSALIVYPVWFYFAGIILDAVGRIGWFFFAGYTLADVTLDFKASYFVIVLLEVARRLVWSFFRVEVEHLANCRAGRVSAEVELPFIVKDLYI